MPVVELKYLPARECWQVVGEVEVGGTTESPAVEEESRVGVV